jgi:D-galactarolactone cycloisomerase
LGLDKLNATWFEAPLDPEDVAGHAALVRAIKTPVAIGEPLRTVREFDPWLDQKAMQIAQPDIVRCGITGGQRIIRKATGFGLKVSPHIGVCTAIGVAATWHVTSVLTNRTTQEHQLDMFETANKVLSNPLRVEAGQAIVPAGPGLGIDVNEDFIRKNSSETWKVTLN